ncbi:MAG: Alpha-galactosidase, partial [Candidatus Hydrogenedentes bacterium]|nr:Alpha-galactosidase [Candidatus Hydrogenedentota bacterium]
VQVFRRQDSVYESARFRLNGLDPEARYRIRNFDESDTKEASGRELIENGLLAAAPVRPSALIFVYTRLP